MPTSVRAPDSILSLRDSFGLHLAADRRPGTAKLYLRTIDLLIAFLEANGMPTGARAVRREHVEAYFAQRRGEVAPATLSIEYRAMVQFFKWAVEEDEITRSPMEKMKPPRVPVDPVPVIPDADVLALLKTTTGRELPDRRDAAIIRLFFDSGMRRGELAGLKLGDVDLKDRVAYVTGSKDGQVRAVRFGTKTAVAIDRYLRVRRTSRYAASEALWLGMDGPLKISAFGQMLTRRARSAGIPHVHAHSFRHTFADAFLADGGEEGGLMRLAGWKSRTMLDRYGAARADARAKLHYASPGDKRL